jgi:hypothetical protein
MIVIQKYHEISNLPDQMLSSDTENLYKIPSTTYYEVIAFRLILSKFIFILLLLLLPRNCNSVGYYDIYYL